MLVRQNRLQDSVDSLLENAIYDDIDFSHSSCIPVVENARLGINIVSHANMQDLQMQHGITLEEAYQYIAEANNIPIGSIAVAIDECDLILDPSLAALYEDNYVVNPLPYDNPVMQVCEALVEQAIIEGDDEYLDIFEEADEQVLNELMKVVSGWDGRKRFVKGVASNIANAAKGHASYYANKAYDKASNYNYKAAGLKAKNLAMNAGKSAIGGVQKVGKTLNNNKKLIGAVGAAALGAHMVGKGIKAYTKAKMIGNIAKAAGGVAKSAMDYRGRSLIAKKISSLGDRIDNLQQRQANASPEQKSILQRMIDRIKSIIARLKAKLGGGAQ